MKKFALVVLMTGLMTATYGWDWNTTVKNGKMVPAGRHLVETGITGDLNFIDVPLNYYYGLLDNITLGLGAVYNANLHNVYGQDFFLPVSLTPGISWRIFEYQGFGMVLGAEAAISYYKISYPVYDYYPVFKYLYQVNNEGLYCLPEAGLYLEFWPVDYSGVSGGFETGYELIQNTSSRGLLFSAVGSYHHIFFKNLTLDVGIKAVFSDKYRIYATSDDTLGSGRFLQADVRMGWMF